jgi:hypothetical protein
MPTADAVLAGSCPRTLLRAFVKFFVTRIGYGNATLVMLGELQEASLDERICLIRKRTDQFGLLAAKASVHLTYP